MDDPMLELDNVERKVLEKTIENAVCRYAAKYGIVAEKFTSPGKRSVPDRLMLVPGGKVFFIEFKAPGKKPTELQLSDHKKRRAMGFTVLVIDDVKKGKRMIDEVMKC